MKKKKIAMMGTACVAAVTAWIAFCGYEWSWGPFAKLHDFKTTDLPGNAAQYAPEQVERIADSPLNGKHIIFLGSSVTYGASSKGVSFADYIAARNGCTITKEAVSGTTLVDEGIGSYISRLKTLDASQSVDIFVCQLSTNDASQKKPLGEIGQSKERDSFDTKTVAGAIEHIIAYARETWNCPVVFYTNSHYDSGHMLPWWSCWEKSRTSGRSLSSTYGTIPRSIPSQRISAAFIWRTASTPPRPGIWSGGHLK